MDEVLEDEDVPVGTGRAGDGPPLMSTGDTPEDRARAVVEALALQPEQRRLLTEGLLAASQLRYAERVSRDRLAASLSDASAAVDARDEAQGEVAVWRDEWQRWAERVLDEARERDWCSSYDDWARESNSNFSRTVLPARMQGVQSTFIVTFTGSIPSGNDEWGDTMDSVLRSLRDHGDAEWVEDWEVSWSRQ